MSVRLYLCDMSESSPHVFEVTGWYADPTPTEPDLLRPIVPGCPFDLSADPPERDAIFEFENGMLYTHDGRYEKTLREWFDEAHMRLATIDRGDALIH